VMLLTFRRQVSAYFLCRHQNGSEGSIEHFFQWPRTLIVWFYHDHHIKNMVILAKNRKKCVLISWIRLDNKVLVRFVNGYFQPRGYVFGFIINLFVLQAIPFVFSFITSPFIKVWPIAINSHFRV